MCYDNFYFNSHRNDDFTISFTSLKNAVSKGNTHYYRLKQFPQLIQFDSVLEINGVSSDMVIKDCGEIPDDSGEIAVIFPWLLRSHRLKKTNQIIDRYKKVLCFFDDDAPEMIENDNVSLMVKSPDIYRNVVNMCHKLCGLPHRTCRWTHAIPETEIHIYGVENRNEFSEMAKCLNRISAVNVDIVWED